MPPLPKLLQATANSLRRVMAQINRSQAAKARDDTRCRAKERRERTRHLIELGGLVQKSGLVGLLEDDRATILGALLESAGRLKSEGQPEEENAGTKALWRRHGLHAFDGEA
jgi:hypothetical protein